MISLLLILQLTGTLVTTEDKLSWVLSGVSEEYANSLKYKYYIGESRLGVDIKDVKCIRVMANEFPDKVKCSMSIPKLMKGTYKIYITSTELSTGIESEKSPYVITIVDKPPMPLEIQRESPNQ